MYMRLLLFVYMSVYLHICSMLFVLFLRILTGKKHSQIKLQHLQKVGYGQLGHWYIKLNQEVLKLKQNFQKK